MPHWLRKAQQAGLRPGEMRYYREMSEIRNGADLRDTQIR